MRKYWLELLILAYAITCIDVVVTAKGILFDKGIEGNPIITMVVPNGHPFLIHYIAITTILEYWFLFYVLENNRFKMPNGIYDITSWLLLGACGTHIFGISTWILL